MIDTNIKEELLSRVKVLIKELNNKQIDREELIQLLVLSLFSLKHIFLLGEPGVSKTEILRIFSSAINSKNSFSICIKHDTSYEEIFGDRYKNESGKTFYDTSNSIVEADFAIIDETWKGNSKVMNSLLSIMSNYRNVDMLGRGSVEVPLLMVGGASNELPTSKEVRPLRDRFLFSYKVEKILGEKHWMKFISRDYDRNPILKTKFTTNEIRTINEYSKSVSVPKNIYDILYRIRQKVVQLKIGVSERKFDGAIDVFLVSAFLNDRKEVDFSELFLIKHIMWEEEKDIEIIIKILNDEIFGKLDEIIKFKEDIENNQKRLLSIKNGFLADFLKFKKSFSYENKQAFEDAKNALQNLIKNFSHLINQAQSLISHYHFSKEVEKIIQENILVATHLSPVYLKMDHTKISFLHEKLIHEKKNLIEWLSTYEDLHVYNMTANTLKRA